MDEGERVVGKQAWGDGGLERGDCVQCTHVLIWFAL